MDKELEKIPGVIWGFSQPIEDNMEEAVSGVKGELSVKIFGDDLQDLEAKGNEIVNVMGKIPGVADLGLFRVIGPAQPEFHGGSRSMRALRHQRGRCAGRNSDGCRR